VVISVHSKLTMDRKAMNRRVVRALRHPPQASRGVHADIPARVPRSAAAGGGSGTRARPDVFYFDFDVFGAGRGGRPFTTCSGCRGGDGLRGIRVPPRVVPSLTGELLAWRSIASTRSLPICGAMINERARLAGGSAWTKLRLLMELTAADRPAPMRVVRIPLGTPTCRRVRLVRVFSGTPLFRCESSQARPATLRCCPVSRRSDRGHHDLAWFARCASASQV
jgi:hypothetical protein